MDMERYNIPITLYIQLQVVLVCTRKIIFFSNHLVCQCIVVNLAILSIITNIVAYVLFRSAKQLSD